MKLSLDDSLPSVPYFADQLDQVVLNLIVNAAHAIKDARKEYFERPGLIEISTKHDGDWVELCITDTGLADEIRDKIYQLFFTTRRAEKASGQGFTISRSVVVDKHGGTIDCESSSAGTKFAVRLPLAPTEPAGHT